MRLRPPPDHKHLDRRGGAQLSGGLWRRVGGAGAAEGGARLSILVFLFRHRYRDPGRPDRLQSRLMPTSAVWIAAKKTKTKDLNQIICGCFWEASGRE